ncbi:MAG: GntR family transcriptional regulator [Candidatus Acidiferrales bacterium]
MQLWFAHGADISIREQLVTQVVLGIMGSDLVPGQRLPSTREVARRFRLHPNTISAGYRQLARERWVEFRRGSGVYVRDRKPEQPISPGLVLDQLIANLFRSARSSNAPLAAVRSRLQHWLELQPPDHFLIIEPDEELLRIVAMEAQAAVAFPVRTAGMRDFGKVLDGAIPVAFPSKAKIVREKIPAGTEVLTLHARSVPTSLSEWLPAPTGALVGVASRWPEFLRLARTMLIAAGFPSDALVFRDARKPHWQRGLKQTAAVVCDAVTASLLPKGTRSVVFPVLSESSLAELKTYENFIRRPLAPSL